MILKKTIFGVDKNPRFCRSKPAQIA